MPVKGWPHASAFHSLRDRGIAVSVTDLLSRTARALAVSLSWTALMAQDAQDVQHKIRALEQQARTFLQEQKPQLAIPVLRDIVSLDPKNVNAQGNLGVLLFFENKYTDAIPHMRAALQMQPALWKIRALLGIAEKRTGQPAQAQTDLETAFSNLDEKNIKIETGLELIELASASARIDQGLSIAAKLQELDPANPRIYFVTYQLSRQMTDQSLLHTMMVAPDSAEIHMMMANELARQGDHTNAIAQYREAIRLNPKLPGAHFELAEQLRTSPDPALNAAAEREYRAALEVNQYDEKSWRQLGRITAANGDFKTAEKYYRKAIALQPDDAEAATGLAIALISMNQANEAMSLLERAVKDDPANIEAHYRLSGLYRRAGRTADSEREMDAFRRYKEVKDKLEAIFKQLAGAVSEN